MIDAMSKSVEYHLSLEYAAHPPAMAMDATPATIMRDAMRKLTGRWLRNFNDLADRLADEVADRAQGAVDRVMNSQLRKAGFSIKFKQTEQMRDAFSSVVGENVGLIKSIPAKYLSDVEGDVMRSVQAGRNVRQLQTDLLKRYDLTKKRAAFIAQDQNNKATHVMEKARRLSIGINEAEWQHSGGGNEPRPLHVEAGREKRRYNVAQGCLIDGEYIMPGEKPRCKCQSRAIIPGFDE
ncbi:phage minor head protein [Chryseobacterium sp.]|uniref:phage minor head protein n=1 Tax=Chryseobacterium sp. TaxID=1871047 RepID=UPI00321982A7